MTSRNIENCLTIILNKIEDKQLVWRLDGSANLKVLGINISVNDIDIVTNNVGLIRFKEVLKEYYVNDFYNKSINSYTLTCKINNFTVEVNYYQDKRLNMFDKIEYLTLGNISINVLPLKNAKTFYELINREEKIKLITEELSKY